MVAVTHAEHDGQGRGHAVALGNGDILDIGAQLRDGGGDCCEHAALVGHLETDLCGELDSRARTVVDLLQYDLGGLIEGDQAVLIGERKRIGSLE